MNTINIKPDLAHRWMHFIKNQHHLEQEETSRKQEKQKKLGLSSNIHPQNVPGGRLQPTCQLLMGSNSEKHTYSGKHLIKHMLICFSESGP